MILMAVTIQVCGCVGLPFGGSRGNTGELDYDTGVLTTADNQQIAYKYYCKGNEKVVVIVHGFFNSKDSELLSQLGEKLSDKYDVFMFDFRGHGESSGAFTWTSNESNDLNSVLDFLKDKYTRTAVIGFSFGGSTSINVLAEGKYKVDSFVSISAPSDLDKVDYKWWQLDWENDIVYSLLTRDGWQGKGVKIGAWWLDKQNPIDNVGELTMPVLYIHGDRDWVVGAWHSENLYENTRTEKDIIVIKEGSHAEYLLRKHGDKTYTAINDWLEKTL